MPSFTTHEVAGLSKDVSEHCTGREWDGLVPLILMSYRATPCYKHGVTTKHDDAGTTDPTADPGHLLAAAGANSRRTNRERVCGGPARRAEGRILSRRGCSEQLYTSATTMTERCRGRVSGRGPGIDS